MNRRSWRRIAALRSARRRLGEIPPPEPALSGSEIPSLAPPDDDREFVSVLEIAGAGLRVWRGPELQRLG